MAIEPGLLPDVNGWETQQPHLIVLKVREFLHSVYDFLDSQNADAAIDKVIQSFEEWLDENDWAACSEALAQAELARLTPAVALAMLSMTLVEKQRLPSRQSFYLRTRHRIIEEYSEEEADKNMIGLE